MSSKKKQKQLETLKTFKLYYNLLSDTDKLAIDNLVRELPRLVVPIPTNTINEIKIKNRIANMAFLRKTEMVSATGYAKYVDEPRDNVKHLFSPQKMPAESTHDPILGKYLNIAPTTITSNVLVRFVPTGLKRPSKRISFLKAPQGWHIEELNVFEKFSLLPSELQKVVISHCRFLLEQMNKTDANLDDYDNLALDSEEGTLQQMGFDEINLNTIKKK